MKERLKWPIKATGTSIRQICKASSRGQLEHFAPRKGNNMNVENTTSPVGEAAIADVKHFYIDAEGNRIEILASEFGDAFDATDGSDGEAAQSEVAFIAEDHADHAVTVH